LTGPGLTSSLRFPDGARSERNENEDVLEVFGITTGADSAAGELALAETDDAGEEIGSGGAPESTRINAVTTAATATTLPAVVQKTVRRRRRIGPPRQSRLSLGKRNIFSIRWHSAGPDSRHF